MCPCVLFYWRVRRISSILTSWPVGLPIIRIASVYIVQEGLRFFRIVVVSFRFAPPPPLFFYPEETPPSNCGGREICRLSTCSPLLSPATIIHRFVAFEWAQRKFDILNIWGDDVFLVQIHLSNFMHNNFPSSNRSRWLDERVREPSMSLQ